jgi:riboflavin kinase/FMN adenylyltransferase
VFTGSSCAFGVFDGVHRGHRYLLDCAIETARADGRSAIALTFDIDPDEVFHPQRLKKLMTNEARIRTLAESGVDAVVMLPFTREFASMEPEEFLRATFNGYAPSHLHIGVDFRFGSHAKGDVATLVEWGERSGTTIDAHTLQTADGGTITATRIRKLLAEPDLDEAERLLGRPYAIVEEVRPGRGEGGDMGFKTANLTLPEQRQALADGVYSGYAFVDGKKYRAAVSVGISPTFEGQTEATCEVHILDFSGDIYGDTIRVQFVEYLRPMIKFKSTEELISTVMHDINHTRESLPL